MSPDARKTALGAMLTIPWAVLTARLWFVCDDAWISFRYGRNLAEGHGLVYNLHDGVPVEGYSNLLWVLIAAAAEANGGSPEVILPLLSAACGAALLVFTGWIAARHLGLDTGGVFATTAFLGLSPAFAAWSTSGLETMPAALAMVVLAERLVLADGPRTWGGAALAATALSLLRTEGPAWVALVVALALALRFARRDSLQTPWWRPPAVTAAVTAAVVAVHVGWRVDFYGDWVSNTARAKVGLSPGRLLRGAKYVGAVATNLAVPTLAVLGLPAAFRLVGLRAAALVALAAAVPAYAVVVGGDYMAFGRLLVAGLPFAALLLGAFVHGQRAVVQAAVVAVVCIGVLPGVGVELSPAPLREALRVRQNFKSLDTEHEAWASMDRNARAWEVQGRLLGSVTRPGETLVTGAIGARGYFSGLDIHDRGGLIDREVALRGVPPDHDPLEHSPGHDHMVDRSFFLARKPTYLEFATFPGDATPARVAREARRWRRRTSDSYAPRVHRVALDGEEHWVVLLALQSTPDAARDAWATLEAALSTANDTPAVVAR